MVAVAIVGVILGLLIGRRERFKEFALAHERAIAELEVTDMEWYLLGTEAQVGSARDAWKTYQARRWKEIGIVNYRKYHELMVHKYERACAAFWRPVDEDPPCPSRPSKAYMNAILAPYRAPIGAPLVWPDGDVVLNSVGELDLKR